MRTKAYRRFMMQKVKRHVKDIIRACWLEPDLSEDKTIVGKVANHGKLCSCECCCNVRRRPHLKGKEKLTRREKISLDDLHNYQRYSEA